MNGNTSIPPKESNGRNGHSHEEKKNADEENKNADEEKKDADEEKKNEGEEEGPMVGVMEVVGSIATHS